MTEPIIWLTERQILIKYSGPRGRGRVKEGRAKFENILECSCHVSVMDCGGEEINTSFK